MHRALALAILLVLASPLAAAQRAAPQLTVIADSPLRILSQGDIVRVNVTVEAHATAPDPSATNGVPVTYVIEGGASWLRARVEPSSGTLRFSASGEARAEFTLILEAPRDATGTGDARLLVRAETDRTLLLDPGEGEAEVVAQLRPPGYGPKGGQAPPSSATPPPVEPRSGTSLPAVPPPDPAAAPSGEPRAASATAGGGLVALVIVVTCGAAGALIGQRVYRSRSGA